MKKYKNAFLSLGTYTGALIWFIMWISIGNTFHSSISPLTGNILNKLVLAGLFILLFISIFFGFKSNKEKESVWAGNLLATLGVISVLLYLLLAAGVQI